MKYSNIKLPPGVARSGTDGVVRDRWYDANFVRWRGPALLPIGNWETITPTALGSVPRRIMSWVDLAGLRRTAILTDSAIWFLEGSAYTNATPADYMAGQVDLTALGYGLGMYNKEAYGTERTQGSKQIYVRPHSYSLDTFGQDMLTLDSSDGRLFTLAPRASVLPPKAVVATGAPISNVAMVVTEERHAMLFGASGNPRRIAWCSQGNYTDWDFASVTNTAGFLDIDTPGFILQAAKVRGGVLVFCDTEVWLMRYLGYPSVYGAERIGQACSVIAPQAFAHMGGSCIWMGHSGFFMFNGGAVAALPCDIGDFIFAHIDRTAAPVRSHGGPNGVFPEAWFFYPSEGNTECNRYVMVNYEDRWWSMGEMSRSCWTEASVYPYPLGGSPTGFIHQHEMQWTGTNALREGMVYAESAPISDPNSGSAVMHYLGGEFDSGHGYDATRMYAYARDSRDGVETQYGPFTATADGLFDCRFSGRDVRLRIEATRGGEHWSIGELRLDARKGGGR